MSRQNPARRETSPPRKQKLTVVYISGASKTTKLRDLESELSLHGKLHEFLFQNGVARASFYNSEDAKNAIKILNGRRFDGAKLSLSLAPNEMLENQLHKVDLMSNSRSNSRSGSDNEDEEAYDEVIALIDQLNEDEQYDVYLHLKEVLKM